MVALVGRITHNFSHMCGHTSKPADSARQYEEVTAQTFLGYSAPCQETAANVRNKLIKSIHDRDTAMVAFRYLQASEGRRVTVKQSVFYSVVALVTSFILPVSLASACHVVVSARNAARYNKTAIIARSHLVNETPLDQRIVKEIDNLSYDGLGLYRLSILLSRKNINVANLDAYRREFKYEKACC